MRRTPLLLVAALSVSLVACSGDAEPEVTAAPAVDGAVTFIGNDAIQWADTTMDATLVDGSLAATLICDGVVEHDLVIEGFEDDAVLATCANNETTTVDVSIEPGVYTFYCSVVGHRAAGMEGSITIS